MQSQDEHNNDDEEEEKEKEEEEEKKRNTMSLESPIPDELWAEILLFLPTRDLIFGAGLTFKFFGIIVDSIYVWQVKSRIEFKSKKKDDKQTWKSHYRNLFIIHNRSWDPIDIHPNWKLSKNEATIKSLKPWGTYCCARSNYYLYPERVHEWMIKVVGLENRSLIGIIQKREKYKDANCYQLVYKKLDNRKILPSESRVIMSSKVYTLWCQRPKNQHKLSYESTNTKRYWVRFDATDKDNCKVYAAFDEEPFILVHSNLSFARFYPAVSVKGKGIQRVTLQIGSRSQKKRRRKKKEKKRKTTTFKGQ